MLDNPGLEAMEVLPMRGELVVLRAVGNKPLVRRVWAVTEDAVLICDEQNYKTLSEGGEGLWPVGFKRKDVFRLTPEIKSTLNSEPSCDFDWSTLTIWQG